MRPRPRIPLKTLSTLICKLQCLIAILFLEGTRQLLVGPVGSVTADGIVADGHDIIFGKQIIQINEGATPPPQSTNVDFSSTAQAMHYARLVF